MCAWGGRVNAGGRRLGCRRRGRLCCNADIALGRLVLIPLLLRRLSFAAALDAIYSKVRLSRVTRAPGAGLFFRKLCADGLG